MKNPKFNRADQLMLGLKDRCQKLNAGEKFLSVRQIMEEFGVSQVTVKQAIERLCESGVLEARDRSGYFVRRDRRYGRIVSILPAGNFGVRHEFTRLLTQEAAEAGFEHEVILFGENPEGIARMSDVRADAIIFSPFGLDSITAAQLNQLMLQPVPVVLINCSIPVENCRYVDSDNEFCGVLAATHLLMNGHRKLALLQTEPDFRVVRERISGFLKCAEAYRLPVELLNPGIRSGENSPAKSYEFFSAYLDANPEPPFTGLFTVSEDPTREVLRAIREHRLSVPGDLSVISLEHSVTPAIPGLTSVNSRRDKIAHCAIQAIRAHFDHTPGIPFACKITPEIHHGATVKNLNLN